MDVCLRHQTRAECYASSANVQIIGTLTELSRPQSEGLALFAFVLRSSSGMTEPVICVEELECSIGFGKIISTTLYLLRGQEFDMIVMVNMVW